MILNKTLENLRKSKESFFNLNDCFLDYDLFKNGICTYLLTNYYYNQPEHLYFLDKKEFKHYSVFYKNDIPRTIKYYLQKKLYYHIPINLKEYNNDLNYFLLKLK